MIIPHGLTIAVADGEKLALFRNKGTEAEPRLESLPEPVIDTSNKGSGNRHYNSSANPSESRLSEDAHAAGIAAHLNAEVLAGRIKSLYVVADPRTLGELRQHWHGELKAALTGELAKNLAGHDTAAITKALEAA